MDAVAHGGGMSASQASRLIWLTFFEDPRTFQQILVSFFAIRISIIAAAGHLTSMRNLGSQSQLIRVLGFAVMPTLPIANLAYRALLVLSVHITRHSLPSQRTRSALEARFPYYISSILGSRATVEGASLAESESSSVDLLEKHPTDLIRTTQSRNLRWISRLLVMSAILAQGIAAVTIWSRRTFPTLADDIDMWTMMYMGWPSMKHKSAAFDVFNGAYAIGGIVTIIHSILLSVCNWKWQYRNPSNLSNQSDRRSLEYGTESHQNFGRELQLATVLFIAVTAEFWKRYLDMHITGESTILHRLLFSAFVIILFVASFWTYEPICFGALLGIGYSRY
ncbi:hypothetical protein DL98DRAFT_658674 [Cadophora sp. DSE1049]|nr:hypothetical protein DL98DRAFT_658674 [Cadophora sp. DSE1049]